MKYGVEIVVVSLGALLAFQEAAFACGLKRGVVKKALRAFLSVFDGYTLADIAGDRRACRTA